MSETVIIDSNKKDVARQIAVKIPENAVLFGLIMEGERSLHALVMIETRFYSLKGSALRPFTGPVQIEEYQSQPNDPTVKQKHSEGAYVPGQPYFRLE
jgi:hypothetical protein